MFRMRGPKSSRDAIFRSSQRRRACSSRGYGKFLKRFWTHFIPTFLNWHIVRHGVGNERLVGMPIKSVVKGTHHLNAPLTSSIALEHGVLAETDRNIGHLRHTSRLKHVLNSTSIVLPHLLLYTHHLVCTMHYPI